MQPDLPRLSINPSDPAFFQNPYRAYRDMHASGGVFHWDEYDHICFAGYKDVNALLRDRRFGREITHVMSREEAGLPEIPPHLETFYTFEANSMLEREPPAHTRLRTLVNRAFVSRSVERLRPRIRALANDLIDALPVDRPVDLLPSFATPIPLTVICELLGVPVNRADEGSEKRLTDTHADRASGNDLPGLGGGYVQ